MSPGQTEDELVIAVSQTKKEEYYSTNRIYKRA